MKSEKINLYFTSLLLLIIFIPLALVLSAGITHQAMTWAIPLTYLLMNMPMNFDFGHDCMMIGLNAFFISGILLIYSYFRKRSRTSGFGTRTISGLQIILFAGLSLAILGNFTMELNLNLTFYNSGFWQDLNYLKVFILAIPGLLFGSLLNINSSKLLKITVKTKHKK